MSIADQVADLRRAARVMWKRSETADDNHARVHVASAERWAREADQLEQEADDPSPETVEKIKRWETP
jgi:hypothetical protein